MVQNDHPKLEEWRGVVGYENYFLVSDYGRVIRLFSTKFIPAGIYPLNQKPWAYAAFSANIDGKRKTFIVHIEVMRAFVGERPEGLEIDHIDQRKTNNRLDNLEYVTHSENVSRVWRKKRELGIDSIASLDYTVFK